MKTIGIHGPILITELDISAKRIQLVELNSKEALELLEINKENRRVRKALIEYIAEQIKNGEWVPDHPQPIVISDAGRVIDGQHRLIAISKSGLVGGNRVAVRIETGCRDSVREYLDTGISRNLEDRVSFLSNPDHNKTVAQLASFNAYFRSGAKTNKPSPESAKAFYDTHKEACLFVARHRTKSKGIGGLPTAYAAMEYYERSPDCAMRFYPALNIVDSDVQQARVLRDWLLRSLGSKLVSTIHNAGTARIIAHKKSVCAMKSHMAGKEIKALTLQDW